MRNFSNVKGYNGYYKGIYLRSFLEFSYAYYLDQKKTKWKYEVEIFELKNVRYKPDFFIYNENGELTKIVEVKGEGNLKTGLEKVNAFKEFYPKIEIEILTYKDLVKLYQSEMPIRLNRAKKIWLTEYKAEMKTEVSGKNNPMYEHNHSEKTKNLISEKAKERWTDKSYKEHMIKSFQNRNYNWLRHDKSERMIASCPNCNTLFTKTIASKKVFCCKECFYINHKSFLEEQRKIGNQIRVKQRKENDNNIKHFIIKWANENAYVFKDVKLNRIQEILNPMYEEIEKQFGVKDKRSISKAIFGQDKGRKEMVIFLKNLVS
jgi:endogenous inhibitor of DNA gyrase (YacG/DUF329 family)